MAIPLEFIGANCWAGGAAGGTTPFDDADFDGNQKEANEKPRKRKSDPADWWKRGETPPF